MNNMKGMENRDWYNKTKKSPLNPPGWIFPIVWPFLYISIIISGFIYIKKGGKLVFPLPIFHIINKKNYKTYLNSDFSAYSGKI